MSTSTLLPVEVRALSVAFPAAVRTNQWFMEHHPAVVTQAEQHAVGLFARLDSASATITFDTAMAPYLRDPFRGTRERRILGPQETSVSLEVRAARDALAAADLTPNDVDLVISHAFLPDAIGIGNAPFVARELGIVCGAWNMESACSSSTVALQLAAALIASGLHHRVLVTISCTYSRTCAENEPIAWSIGDGAAAILVERASQEGVGLLGHTTVNTVDTCGSVYYQLELDAQGAPKIAMRATPRAGQALRAESERCVRRCCEGAAAQAGLALSDIDFFIVNTPSAWYADFVTSALGVPRNKTIDTHKIYCNTGPALMPGNLYHALAERRIRPGDLVLLYAIGSVSTASAAVFRWGETRLGPAPAPPADHTLVPE